MGSYQIQGFVSFTLAIILLFLGKLVIGRFELLKRYSVPEPVIGGFLCASAVGHWLFCWHWQRFSLFYRILSESVLPDCLGCIPRRVCWSAQFL